MTPKNPIIALLLLPIASLLCSCAPSGMILSAARGEYQILNADSTQPNVERYLGKPLEEERIEPNIRLRDFKFPKREPNPNSRFQSHLIYYADGYAPELKDEQIVATRCRYSVRGKIVPHGYIGDANMVALATLGLGEIIMIPTALHEVSTGRSIENFFEVWYSNKGTVLAYHWQWIPPDSSKK